MSGRYMASSSVSNGMYLSKLAINVRCFVIRATARGNYCCPRREASTIVLPLVLLPPVG